VQASAKISESSRRGGITALAAAWLMLLAVVSAGATYVVVASQATPPPNPPLLSVTLPAEPPAAPAEKPRAAGSDTGVQPAVAGDGKPPAWRQYAALHADSGDRPRIAVVMTGLGLSGKATQAAIKDLPSSVTLSFTPYAGKLNEWMTLARGNGHEVMLDLPMEPVTYPDDDPGPQTLLTQLDPAENRQRLLWVLGRTQGYVGVAAVMGSRFSDSEIHLEPILREVKTRGLMFLDNRASESSVAARLAEGLRLPHAVSDRTLDGVHANRATIDARLAQIERVALSDGASVAIARPYPATIEHLREWARTLEARGFALVPVTALAQGGDSP
jgi:polysaccharide deacetylase 2 family uncharacterized protein YibQ